MRASPRLRRRTNCHMLDILLRLSDQRGDAYCLHAEDARLPLEQGLPFQACRIV